MIDADELIRALEDEQAENTRHPEYDMGLGFAIALARQMGKAESQASAGWQDIRHAVYESTDYTGVAYEQKLKITEQVMNALVRMGVAPAPSHNP